MEIYITSEGDSYAAIADRVGVDEGYLDEGFMAEDENGTSELEGSAASDESDLFLNDGE